MTTATDRAKAILARGHPQGVRCRCCPAYHDALRTVVGLAEAVGAGRAARLATGRQSTCDKQAHGDSHIQCGKCFICLERKALALLERQLPEVR